MQSAIRTEQHVMPPCMMNVHTDCVKFYMHKDGAVEYECICECHNNEKAKASTALGNSSMSVRSSRGEHFGNNS